MKRVHYEDADGRKWMTELPDGAPDADASLGLPVGPPSLERLKLPLDIEVLLHNQLFERNILTLKDAKRNGANLLAAWQAALKVNIHRLMEVYLITDEEL